MENSGMDIAAVRRELYKASGLLGVSGLSADLRDLLASPRPEAELAIELYCYRAAREVGALAVQAGGLDALVFTAGVGEHSAEVRQRILARLAWLGFSLDPAANLAHATCLTTADSRLSAWVIPTDEEGQMAREAAAVLGVR
jgi:acetate kinase